MAEYYPMITEACSLKCTYCYRNRKNRDKRRRLSYTPGNLIKFVERRENELQTEKRELKEAQVVFYGGEPTANQKAIDFMAECMFYPADVPIKFALQTNGVNLHEVPSWVMDRFSALLISIDGFQEITDKNRGEGVYNRIVQNLEYIPPRLRESTIARITLTIDPINSIFRSVIDLSQHFDPIYWQIQSLEGTPSDIEVFEEQYKKDIKGLLKYWIDEMRKGKVKKLIPFLTIAYPIISNIKHQDLRCACGRELVYIRPDGICFPCAELTWKEDLILGDIWSGISYEGVRKYSDSLKMRCAICRYRDLCGGRCLSCFLRLEAPFEFYCGLTKFLIDQIFRIIPEIKELIAKGVITLESLNPKIVSFTEEIP